MSTSTPRLLYVGCFLLNILFLSIFSLIPDSFVLVEHCLRHFLVLFSSITRRALGTFTPMECIPSGMSSSLHFGESRSAGEHLSVSSGNVQLLPVQHREGIENQYPLPALSSGRQTPQQFPIPSLKLGSNDDSHHGFHSRPRRHPLRPRRTRQADPDRPYLVHPKYIEYRSRPRQDIGKDGKPIWPDHIEAAFQDGKLDHLFQGEEWMLTIDSSRPYQADGSKEVLSARKAVWTEYAHCRMDLPSNRP
jgi:hypothetical protein